MKPKVRVAVIGLGFGQQVHLPAFMSHPHCQVVSVCSQHLDKASKVAAQNHIPHHTADWNRLILDPSIDAVSIATSPALQEKIILKAIANRKAVFCEKPLALRLKTAKQMTRLARQKKLANMVDFEFSESPVWQKARALIAAGKIGRLRHLSVHWGVETYANRANVASWKTNSLQGGGALSTFASHVFYYVEWFIGKISSLSAQMERASDLTHSSDSLVWLLLKNAKGVCASAEVSTHSFMGNGHRLEFYGSMGTLILENKTKDYINGFQLFLADRSSPRFRKITVVDRWRSYADGRLPATSQIVNRFIEWIRSGKASVPNFESGLRVQRLMEAAKKSAKTKRWVLV